MKKHVRCFGLFLSKRSKYYRKETQDIVVSFVGKDFEEHAIEAFSVDQELQSLLEAGNTKAVCSFIQDRVFDWTREYNYQRFLHSVTKTQKSFFDEPATPLPTTRGF